MMKVKVRSVTAQFPAASAESILHNSSELSERNCMGSSDCSSSVDSSAIPVAYGESRSNMNLKATELRLGLSGSQSPGRDAELGLLSSSTLDEKPLFPLHPVSDGTTSPSHKIIASGNKRGFLDAVSGFSKGKLISSSDVSVALSPKPSSSLDVKSCPFKESSTTGTAKRALVQSNTSAKHVGAANHDSAPALKAQVVGWPPIRSFRKNSMITTSKNNGVDGKVGNGVLFVKVSMDGTPYLRKDKDGDWMLVGDVPWEMFVDTCRRLRIMKSSDAIGLAPRALEKCRNRH